MGEDKETASVDLGNVLRKLDEELDGIESNRELDRTRKISQLAGGDAYRLTSQLVLMVGEGSVFTLDQFQGSRVTEGSRKGWVQDMAGYVSLYMMKEPVQNQQLYEETSRARTAAKALRDSGITPEKWMAANEKFQLLMSNRPTTAAGYNP